MKALQGPGLVVGVVLSGALLPDAQTPVGALAIDERQGAQWGWAVDYETAGEARQRALSERGSGCSVVLTFERCAAYAADQEGLGTGDVFRDCESCPEMVVLPGGGLALGRYEVTVGEYRAFASATGAGAEDCIGGESWRDPGFSQTDRHPVVCVSWDDAQAYVSWLSRTTGLLYRLPTAAEWERGASGSQPGCYGDRTGLGTCPVGSYGAANASGLSDMVGNVYEWTADCWEGDCGRRVLRGGSWDVTAEYLRPGARLRDSTAFRYSYYGFRVSRTLD